MKIIRKINIETRRNPALSRKLQVLKTSSVESCRKKFPLQLSPTHFVNNFNIVERTLWEFGMIWHNLNRMKLSPPLNISIKGEKYRSTVYMIADTYPN